MPKYKAVRTHSPFMHRNKTTSPSPRGVSFSVKDTNNFSIFMPQSCDSSFLAISHQKAKLINKIKICTGLTPAIDKKSAKTDPNTSALENTVAKPETSNKDKRSNFNLLTNGIKVKRIQEESKLSAQPKLAKLEITEERTLRAERRSQPNSLDSWNEILNAKPDVEKSCLIIKKSNLASYEEYFTQKNKFKEMYAAIRPLKVTLDQKKNVKERITIPHVKKVAKKIEKISVKEAMRDKEWVSKAKSQIIKDMTFQISWSNGMRITPPCENFFTYKYYLGRGNNARLVQQCLNSRWWWTRVTKEEIDKANFIWTQWKDKNIIESLSSLSDIKHDQEAITSPVSISCNTRFVWISPTTNISQTKIVDLAPLGYDLVTKSESFSHIACNFLYNCSEMKICNKIEHNYHLSNKKALFANLRQYYLAIGKDPFDYIPVTFHITKGENDEEFVKFEEIYNTKISAVSAETLTNIWIVKPGENTNRGNGITVCSSLEQIKGIIRSSNPDKTNKRTFIIQKYVENPFLVHKRKFDIRCYALITCFNGVVQGYYYNEGYLRTSCKSFSINNIEDPFTHLTNDAIQKQSEDYGKFESGNKMSYSDFQRYLDSHPAENQKNFLLDVLPKMKEIVKDTIQSVCLKIDPKKRAHTFEIFGYDFLLDSELKPWLLEVNTNPCLELSSPHLARIIPSMLENSFRIALDTIFQEPTSAYRRSTNSVILEPLPENRYELVFHSCNDGEKLIEELKQRGTLEDFMYIDPSIQEISEEIDEEAPSEKEKKGNSEGENEESEDEGQ
ncbi:unnamed protein product [Blepharisma stoltei]|uniref:Tubulin-tyrosine ligase family protein n=1 Tax=Blepharisma stoltei TaxID=1481888 RepID=A0AAU9J4D7_9CILI|nr:unnamed protein product [Blepharisma stoltei]